MILSKNLTSGENEVRLDKIQRANSKTDFVQLKILILD